MRRHEAAGNNAEIGRELKQRVRNYPFSRWSVIATSRATCGVSVIVAESINTGMRKVRPALIVGMKWSLTALPDCAARVKS